MEKALNKISNIALFKSKPISVVQFVTNRCNARCSHCFIDFNNAETQKQTMSIDEINKVSQTIGTQLMNVNLTGGEPFLRRDLFEVASAYVLNAKVNSVFITTHGGLTDKVIKFAEQFKAKFPDKLLVFSISLDGFEEEHNAIRKIPGLYAKALKTYHALKGMGGNILVNTAITVTPFNYEKALAFYQHLKTVEKVHAVTVTLVRDEGVFKTPEGSKEGLVKVYDQLTQKLHEDIQAEHKAGYSKQSYLGRMMNEKNKIMNELISQTYKENKYILPCQSGKLFGIIYPSADVYPCEILDKAMGNLRDFDCDFNELWQSQQSKQITKWIKDTNCFCTYECAWSFNILASPKYYGNFFGSLFRG